MTRQKIRTDKLLKFLNENDIGQVVLMAYDCKEKSFFIMDDDELDFKNLLYYKSILDWKIRQLIDGRAGDITKGKL